MNVILQITHPMIEEMQVVHEREMAELRSQMQDELDKMERERDEYLEKADNAYAAASEQDSIVASLKKAFIEIKKGDPEKGIAPRSVTLNDLLNNFATPDLRYGEKDYDVFTELEKVLSMVEPTIEYVDREVIKTVYRDGPTRYELPRGFKADLATLIAAANKLDNYI